MRNVYLTGFMSTGEFARDLQAQIGEPLTVIDGVRDAVYSLTNIYDELCEIS